MIIHRDLISHEKMFSDIYKIREVEDGLCLGVEGKMVRSTGGNIDDSFIGGNASAEGPEGEGMESTVITGVDIVMNHHLQETSFTKEAYKKYIKHILANFKNDQFFIGESMTPDGVAALLDYSEDGVTPCMISFKDGLEMEKCVDEMAQGAGIEREEDGAWQTGQCFFNCFDDMQRHKEAKRWFLWFESPECFRETSPGSGIGTADMESGALQMGTFNSDGADGKAIPRALVGRCYQVGLLKPEGKGMAQGTQS
ncbi:translationally-controlled tumor protein-like [Eubalaena glacialis]|uniref:translationally-controlled tumor protein-like n=1 Tax=Eubalaena glacialis TaxID=27606 RepID=UPI002A5A8561|nr:translationally-controlled tumor protein-like [Eubalaena glacialis]